MRTPLSTREAAEQLGVDVSTINRWAATGRLRALRQLPGTRGVRLFDPLVVDKLAQDLAKQAQAEADAAKARIAQ
jgi:excisionase family DNA binding protein